MGDPQRHPPTDRRAPLPLRRSSAVDREVSGHPLSSAHRRAIPDRGASEHAPGQPVGSPGERTRRAAGDAAMAALGRCIQRHPSLDGRSSERCRRRTGHRRRRLDRAHLEPAARLPGLPMGLLRHQPQRTANLVLDDRRRRRTGMRQHRQDPRLPTTTARRIGCACLTGPSPANTAPIATAVAYIGRFVPEVTRTLPRRQPPRTSRTTSATLSRRSSTPSA